MMSADDPRGPLPWPDYIVHTIRELKERGLYRQLKILDSAPGAAVKVGRRSVLLFCSNDYLGLAADPRMKTAAVRAVRAWGTGVGASRLISGNIALYRTLEQAVSRLKRVEAAVVFASGYATNVGVITSLAGPGDLILSDALNHASIVDACRLSKAQIAVYPHRDVAALETLLRGRSARGRVMIVTDGVFSMDGDLAPLPELTALSRESGALLVVDDAHGTGVIGPNGGGVFDHFGLKDPSALQLGTFSKALGSLGGFAAASTQMVDFLVNHARSLIYSTGLPPPVLAANAEAIRIIVEEPNRRKHLHRLSSHLRDALAPLGFSLAEGPTPIIPLVVGEAEEAVRLSAYLWDEGIFVPPIRPPTVPAGQSRLRVSLSALHRQEDVDRLVYAIKDYFRQGS
ncbi:8-amino-7-oxononanoate synthase [uncultured Desulfatiglans sp.]|nr:8-amino-7-oxononanoate synthase [uncultured Desulfatiglans sp.]